MVAHPARAAHAYAPSQGRPPSQQQAPLSRANTPSHAKKISSSSSSSSTSSSRASSREERRSRDGSAQRAAQDVAGLKDYQLGDCLGKGAFGSVYRALNWGTGETVAIKQVRTDNMGAAELKNIMLEIDLLKNLNHPNIVKYHGFVKGTESLYIILEYCENGSLHSICKNFGKFPENLVSLYMAQVLQGLLYLHEQGVIHRDIKGANILTTKEGLVKLADFGVATKATGLDQSSVVGTPYWMAPEVIELSGATTASDIWSLGCTVIELIEGKPPYHKLQPMQALFRIVNDEHPPIPGSVSSLLRDFLMECFQKNPTLRISAKRLLKHAWIQSAKRTVPAVPTKLTEYTEAVKSVQEWNEALRSPNSLRPSARLASGSSKAFPSSAMGVITPRKPSSSASIHNPKQRLNAETFRTPEIDTSDNWDDDFAESISPKALRLTHLKPQDNFAGLLSSDRLKSFAGFDAVAEEPSNLDGEATVKSPNDLHRYLRDRSDSFDEPLTVKSSSIRVRPPTSRTTSFDDRADDRSDDRPDNNPKTAILRGLPKAAQLPKTKVAALARPSTLFREDSTEDYTDLLPADEDAFAKRVKAMQGSQPLSILSQNNAALSSSPAESFSPRLFHPNDLRNDPKSARDTKSTGAIARQRSGSVASVRKMQRTQSDIEIQKYAEDEHDDFSDVWGDIKKPAVPESDSGSEHSSSMALVTSKMSSSTVMDDDEMDPFANLEEGIENIDLENNVARDRDDRLAKQTESLVGCLKTNQPDEELLELADELLHVLYESPDKKAIVLRSHGLLPILEILATFPPNEVVLPLLKIINMIIFDDAESQESLSFLGGIPIICNFAYKKYPSEIRQEAAAFVRQMYQTSTLTLQIFLGCGGINVLVEFLEEDIDCERDLVLIGVNGVWNVFGLQGSTPRNDFCRILSRSSVLYPLSLVLSRVVEEEGEIAEMIEGRIVNIFLIFSQAESHVKDMVADRMILKRVLKDLRKMSPTHQVTMLKFIKNLSMLSSTHEALQNSNAIDTLIEFFKASKSPKHKHPYEREIANQILNTMYNLCRHNKSRQEEAALSDVIPLLKEVVQQGGPLKEFALPILCELAHSGKVARKMLWDAKGLAFYLGLLGDRNWQVTALDAILVWLQEETARIESYLLKHDFAAAIVAAYTSDVSQTSFEGMLEPLQKIVRLSPSIAASLAVPEIFFRTRQKLGHKDAVTRLNLLRILRTICDATNEQCTLIRHFDVYDTILDLSKHDQAILVRQMAEELVRACDSGETLGGGLKPSSISRASGFRRPASSAGVRAGSGSSSGSGIGMTPPTPTTNTSFKGARDGKFVIPTMSPLPPSTPSSNRDREHRERERERVGRSQSTAGLWDLQPQTSPRPVPLMRTSTALTAVASPTSASPRVGGGLQRPPSRDNRESNLSGARLDVIHRDRDREVSTSLMPNLCLTPGKSRLPKARSGRLSTEVGFGTPMMNRRASRQESSLPMSPYIGGGEDRDRDRENHIPTPTTPNNLPLPRLQIARRRRDTSGSSEVSALGGVGGRRGSRVGERDG